MISPAATATTNPYVGIRPFSTDDTGRFFGRDAEIVRLRALLFANRMVVLHAPSGAGKTSLVQAGLIPALDTEFEHLPIGRVSGADPQTAASASVDPFTYNVLVSWGFDPSKSKSLRGCLARRRPSLGEHGLKQLRLAVIDQFEELFTWYPGHWAARTDLIRQIRQALESDSLLRVLLVIRDDHLGALEPLLGELGPLTRVSLHLDLLRPEQAVLAIEGPVEPYPVRYGPGVAESLASELATVRVVRNGETIEVPGEYVEPVQLQVVCAALWDNLPPSVSVISEEDWRRFGRVDDALDEFYLGGLNKIAREHDIARVDLERWFEHHLITEAHTRNTVIRLDSETAGLPNEVIDSLAELRLIRSERRLGARWYELTHDRLVGVVERRQHRRDLDEETRSRKISRRVLAVTATAGVVLAGVLVWAFVELSATQTQANQAETQVSVIQGAQDQLTVLRRARDHTRLISETLAADREPSAETLDTLDVQAQELGEELATLLSEQPNRETNNELRATLASLEEGQAAIEEFGSDSSSQTEAADRASAAAAIATTAEEEATEKLDSVVAAPPTTQPPDTSTTVAPPTTAPAPIDTQSFAADALVPVEPMRLVESEPSYVETPVNDEGYVVLDFDIPEAGAYDLLGLVDPSGSDARNSFRVSIDSELYVGNLPANETLNVRSGPSVEFDVLDELDPFQRFQVALTEERIPVTESDETGADWYRLARYDGYTEGGDSTGRWINSAFVGWEIWDAFEQNSPPPVGFEWDGITTRCQPGDAFDRHSCGPERLFDTAGSHLLILRGREGFTRLAGIAIESKE